MPIDVRRIIRPMRSANKAGSSPKANSSPKADDPGMLVEGEGDLRLGRQPGPFKDDLWTKFLRHCESPGAGVMY